MAILKKGIIGGIRGKIGAVIGCHSKGKSIIQATPKHRKKVTNQTMRQNGSNLLNMASVIKAAKPLIAIVLNDWDSSLSFDWNTAVRQCLKGSVNNPQSGVRPMSFGVDEFQSGFEFYNSGLSTYNFLAIEFRRAHSILANYPNAIFHYQYYDTNFGYGVLHSRPNVANSFIYTQSDNGLASNQPRIFFAWMEDVASGKRSQLTITANTHSVY